MSTNRTEVTYQQRQVTMRGRLMGRWPTGLVQPLAGFPVYGTAYPPAGPGGAPSTTTRADGTFAMTVTMGGHGWVQAHYPASDDHAGFLAGDSSQLPIGVRGAPTRLTLSVSSTRLVYPEEITVTMTPTVSGWLEIGHSTADPFLGSVTKTSAQVSVLHRTEFIDFTATRTGTDQVTVGGHLQFLSGGTPYSEPVQIQYRPLTGGDWQTVATLATSYSWQGHAFGTTVTQPAAGFWRAHYPGRPQLWLPATSTRVRVDDTDTRAT